MRGNLPRKIRAELVQVGDTIEVTHKPERGLTMKYQGKVDSILYRGDVRRLVTDENATILAWEPSKPNALNVVLIKREPVAETLFSNDWGAIDEVRSRVNV